MKWPPHAVVAAVQKTGQLSQTFERGDGSRRPDQTLTQIGAGVWHSCGLDAAGAVYCWGGNASGELGNDSFVPSAVPVLVGL